MASPAQIVDIAEAGLIKKATTPFPRVFLCAIYAGASIALGFIFYTTTQVGASALPYGLTKLIGAVVFSTGLAMVIMTGTDLFTSTSMTLMAEVDGKLPWRRLFPPLDGGLCRKFCRRFGGSGAFVGLGMLALHRHQRPAGLD